MTLELATAGESHGPALVAIVSGLPAIGTWTAAGFYDCNDDAMFRARDYYRSGEDCAIDVILPDGCGWTFIALVNTFDVTLGVIFIVLLLEATRRTSGWIMPVVAILFIAYAMLGPYLPPPWTHRGYTFSRLVGHLFITLEGIFGVAVALEAPASQQPAIAQAKPSEPSARMPAPAAQAPATPAVAAEGGKTEPKVAAAQPTPSGSTGTVAPRPPRLAAASTATLPGLTPPSSTITPKSTTATVARGDSLWRISQRYASAVSGCVG